MIDLVLFSAFRDNQIHFKNERDDMTTATKNYYFKPMSKKEGCKDLDSLIRTVYGEARGEEKDDGRIAVAHVIRNRAVTAFAYFNKHGRIHPLFGDGSLFGVCHAAFQFSCWNKGDVNLKIITAFPDGGEPYQKLKSLLIRALNADDITGGATHYHEKHEHPKPDWAKGATVTMIIGNHIFYKVV